MLKIRKIVNNITRGKNINLKFCFSLHKVQTVELVWPRAQNGRRNVPSKNFVKVSTWKKKKKGKTSKFVNAGCYNRNERGGI